MKINKLSVLPLFCLFVFSLFSCSNDSEDDLINSTGIIVDGETVSYDANVRSIMQSSCVGCHSSPPVNGAPFALVNFNQVSQRANSILNVMSKQSGTSNAMPPSGRLPQSTVNIIEQWIANGKPEN